MVMKNATKMKIDEQRLTALKAYPLAYRLQQLRAWNDYTQKEFATLVGTRQATVSMWERGLCIPNYRNLDRIISACCLPDDFFDDIHFEKINPKEKEKKK